jgi:hypothetical protein
MPGMCIFSNVFQVIFINNHNMRFSMKKIEVNNLDKHISGVILPYVLSAEGLHRVQVCTTIIKKS